MEGSEVLSLRSWKSKACPYWAVQSDGGAALDKEPKVEHWMYSTQAVSYVFVEEWADGKTRADTWIFVQAADTQVGVTAR